MAFEKITQHEQTAYHPHQAILAYHFSKTELRQLQNIARLTGVKDLLIVQPDEIQNTLYALLEGQINKAEEVQPELVVKALVFNNVSPERMNAFIEMLKKCRLQRPLIAVVTKTSINWTFSTLLSNLIEEHAAMQNHRTAHD